MEYLHSLTLTPLSAGDIIDRAVRLYRRHFLTLLRIVVAPSLLAYAGGIAMAVAWKNLWTTSSDAGAGLNAVLLIAGIAFFFVGKVGFFVMLGGTSRGLVNYFLDGTPLRARDVFRAVRERLWALVGATIMALLLLLAAISMVYTVVVLAGAVYVMISLWLLRGAPEWVQVLVHTTAGLVFGGALLVLLLLIYGRIVYLPQALMVEGKGVFSALSRSFTLAGRDVRRIGAIFIFQFYVAWSLLVLLAFPLGWYASLNGVDISPFGGEKPLWYNISYQTLTQLSEILLAPIAMLGFTLLYIDSRVRKEGFDIELLANRQMPAPNLVPPPPVARPAVAQTSRAFPSILGLDGYRPQPAPQPWGESDAAPVVAVNGEIASEERYCPSCGKSRGPADRFCRHCGAACEARVEVEG
jgi:hypothetical protein